jgi:hypothetical protein
LQQNLIRTNNNQTHQYIKKLAEKKEAPEKEIERIVVNSFTKYYLTGDKAGTKLHFDFKDEPKIYEVYEIVDNVNNPAKEISRNNPMISEGEIKEGKLYLLLDSDKFSSYFKKIEEQMKKELENINWNKQQKDVEEYRKKKELVKGNVINSRNEYYIVELIDIKGATAL